MGKVSPKCVEGRTKEDRVRIRKRLGSLKQITVQPATRVRYDRALKGFFSFLKFNGKVLPTDQSFLDELVGEYLEHLWANGEGRALGSYTLAAIQDAQPQVRGKLQQSWRLMKSWVSNEMPNRAPPLSEDILHALVGLALFRKDPLFALSLLVGFYSMLRAGEILGIMKSHVSPGAGFTPAVISLGLTKAGKRQGAAESVTVSVADVVRRLSQWKESAVTPINLCPPAPYVASEVCAIS